MAASKRLMKEFKDAQSSTDEEIRLHPEENNVYDWKATLKGCVQIFCAKIRSWNSLTRCFRLRDSLARLMPTGVLKRETLGGICKLSLPISFFTY